MTDPGTAFKIAAIQACPEYLNSDATVDKACALIKDAGAKGAALATFPEAFLPGYPLWVWFIPPGHTAPYRELYAILLENSVVVPSEVTDRLCMAAREANLTVAIGINERNIEGSGSTLYNTLLFIGPDGSILGKHRKLIPTAGERLVWGQGDGSDMEVYQQPFGKLGGLLCWENYMPLARYALYAWGVEILVAPTWDRGEPWLSTMRHVAKEGRCFVVGCCQAMHKDAIPDSLEFKRKYLGAVEGWVNPGHSVIVDPDGKVLAGPSENEETILVSEVRRDLITGPRFQLDTAGHYARPDVFEFTMHKRPKPFITVVQEAPEQPECEDETID